ncbi:MBL fold metallo-hydrolase, partial [Kitasatospora nipponensis]|uniref:MBL fold metallo-hydrolase n=1 Tax=Kitasatospora nipponensis TaxID=258049 RepID=UPI0031D5AD04
YPVIWYGDDPLVLADGDAQFDRIDSVVLRVYDTGYEAAASDRATIEILKGTPAAPPVAPALPAAPAGAVRLTRPGAPAGRAVRAAAMLVPTVPPPGGSADRADQGEPVTPSPPPEQNADAHGAVPGGARSVGGRGLGAARAGRGAGGPAPVGPTPAAPLGPPLEIAVFTGPESAFFATSSLILGARDAILVDAQLTRSAGRELAEWIAGKGRNLLAVVITHPHPDHYFGVEEVLRLFPQAHVLAAPQVVAAIARTAGAKVLQWRPVYGDDIPDAPVLPRALLPQPLMIDRQLIRVLYLGQGDCADCTVVHVPASRTVIAGDCVYNGTHVWTAETTTAERVTWARNLVRIAELGAHRVIAGHRAPDQGDEAARVLTFTGEYLQDFDRVLARYPTDADSVVAAMSVRYGELTLPAILAAGAAANTSRRVLEPPPAPRPDQSPDATADVGSDQDPDESSAGTAGSA